jgi:hypothetical protein
MVEPEKAQRLREFLARHHDERAGQPSSGVVLEILDEAAAGFVRALDEIGVDSLILKGPALDALLYGEDERRRYVDIDVLVSPSDLRAAERTLESLGYRNAGAHLGIDDVGGVVHAETWIRLQSGSLTPQIELHRWFPGAQGRPDEVWAMLWSQRTQISLRGIPVWVLDVPGQAMQLATHLAQHGPRYARGAWELRLALERWPAEVWQRAADLARRIGAIEPFATGLQLVAPSAALTEELHLPSATGAVWDAEHRDEFPRGLYFLEATRKATGAERLRVVRRALLPSARWIAYTYRLGDEPGRLRLAAAYAQHLARAPVWTARAAWFSRRRRRAAQD